MPFSSICLTSHVDLLIPHGVENWVKQATIGQQIAPGFCKLRAAGCNIPYAYAVGKRTWHMWLRWHRVDPARSIKPDCRSVLCMLPRSSNAYAYHQIQMSSVGSLLLRRRAVTALPARSLLPRPYRALFSTTPRVNGSSSLSLCSSSIRRSDIATLPHTPHTPHTHTAQTGATQCSETCTERRLTIDRANQEVHQGSRMDRPRH